MIKFYEKPFSYAIYEFLQNYFSGYIEIIFNYAIMTIEMIPPSASDRGKYKILASHKLDHQKVYIDRADGFPRYYFNYDCMMIEIECWIKGRKILEINEVFLIEGENILSLRNYINKESIFA